MVSIISAISVSLIVGAAGSCVPTPAPPPSPPTPPGDHYWVCTEVAPGQWGCPMDGPPGPDSTFWRGQRQCCENCPPPSIMQQNTSAWDVSIFADMHDGDEKEVTINGDDLTIKPHNNGQQWVVNAKIFSNKATIDFDVPGKEAPPPVPLQAQLFTSYSASGFRKRTLIFSDDSGVISQDPTFPLNQWVSESADEAVLPPVGCPNQFNAIFQDMHNGNQKQIIIEGEDLTIIHSGDYQKWIATAKLNRQLCSAVIDFNEQGEPDYPPGNLTATYWVEVSQNAYSRSVQATFEFTDPSGVLAPAVHPLNRWVQLNFTSPWWTDAIDVIV